MHWQTSNLSKFKQVDFDHKLARLKLSEIEVSISLTAVKITALLKIMALFKAVTAPKLSWALNWPCLT